MSNSFVEIIEELNPWWSDGQIPEEDGFQRRPFYKNFEIDALKLDRRAVILLGPRRVGKSVMLMQLVAKCLKTYPKDNVCFISFDEDFPRDIRLKQLVNMVQSRKNYRSDQPSIFIFDEVQSITDWKRKLKRLVDINLSTKVRFICSGSAISARRRKGSESGLGRLEEFHVPHLLFCEYLKFGVQWPDWLPDNHLELLNTKLSDKAISILNEHFLDYLTYGAYPEIVLADLHRNKERVAQQLSAAVAKNILYRELPVEYGIRNENVLDELFRNIAENNGREFSSDKFSNEHSIAKSTISNYMDYFQAAYLIRKVEKLTVRFTRQLRSRTSKIYLNNPSMFASYQLRTHARDIASQELGYLIENAVLCQFENRNFEKDIDYARWEINNKVVELDFIESEESFRKILRIIEVKWSDRVLKNEDRDMLGYINLSTKVIKKFRDYTKLYLLTKSSYGKRQINNLDIQMLPVAHFCLAVGLEHASKPQNVVI